MNWDEIKKQVEKNGDVWTVTMEVLRDANSSGKLGVNVIEQIASNLAGVGLGHVPRELPSYQDQQVRLYKRGTPAGDMIDKVLTPGQQGDQIIVAKFAEKGPDYAAIIQKIRELIGE